VLVGLVIKTTKVQTWSDEKPHKTPDQGLLNGPNLKSMAGLKMQAVYKSITVFLFSCLPRCLIKMCLVKPTHILMLPRHIWVSVNYAHFGCVSNEHTQNVCNHETKCV